MTPADIVAALRAAQIARGWSDRRVELEAGVSHKSWTRTRTGERDPRLGVICAIADALGVSITAGISGDSTK